MRIEDKLTLNELDSEEYQKMISRLENEEIKNNNPDEFEMINVLHSNKNRQDVSRNFSML